MKIALISVYSSDRLLKDYYYTFLYACLAQRKPYQNISHKELPTYEDHKKFVDSKPYKDWFIIYDMNTKSNVGSIYLSKENEIGIFISEKNRKQGYGKQAIMNLLEYFNHIREVKANIAPLNSTSICFFVNFGFKWDATYYQEKDENNTEETIIQYTYKIINPYYVENAQEEVKA